MEQSFYLQYIQRYFQPLLQAIVATLNGTTNPVTYLHKTMLKTSFSVTGKFESLSTYSSQVMADVVSMNSTLPLKARDSISKVTGDIPKMGLKLALDEKQMTDIDTLIAVGGTEEQLVSQLFEDAPKVINAIYERNEAIFLKGLSSGVAIVDENENVGTGIRIDYGYPTANKFGVSVLWNSPSTAKPFDDIQRMLDKASTDGSKIITAMMDRTAFNNLAKTQQAKDLYQAGLGLTGTGNIVPTLKQLNQVLADDDRYGFTIQIVDRSVTYEKDGQQTSYKPWQVGSVIFLTTTQVGSLVYARLAEQNRPKAGVEYQTVDSYILVSKYGKNEPLEEWTAAQARVLPVISGVSRIYQIDSTQLQA